MPNTRKAERKEAKRTRVPFGAKRSKLQLSQAEQEDFERAGYHAHWFNDEHGRIQEALSAGYEFVQQSEALSLGHGQLHEGNQDLSNRVSKHVNKRPPEKKAFLMKIPLEFYKQDQEAKEEVNRQVDNSLRQGTPGGNVVENQYVPSGHTQKI